MAVSLKNTPELLLNFSTKAEKIFSAYNTSIIQRLKKDSNNIDSKYICQFTIELLTRQAGGLRGAADRLAEVLETDSTLTYSASAICKARKKFPPQLFLDINQSLIDEVFSQKNLFKKRRLFAIDGSKIVLPKQLEKSNFKTEKKESHYPMGRLSRLYEIETQLIHDVSLNSHCDERKAAIGHFHRLCADDILIYDRGYFSFHLLAAHRKHQLDFVMRFSEKTGVKEFENFIQESADRNTSELQVKISPVGTKSIKKIAADYPSENQEFSVRLIKYTYEDKSYYMVTSLLRDKDCPTTNFPDLYHSRWGVEEAYKQLKVYLLRKEFHGACYTTVRQEIYAAALVVNMSRILALSIEKTRMVGKKKPYCSTGDKNLKMAGQQVICLLSNNKLRHFTL